MTWIWLLAAAAAWVGARSLARAILPWSRARRLGVANYRDRWVPTGLGIAWTMAAAAATGSVAAVALAVPWLGPDMEAGAEAGALAALAAWILWAALVGWVDDLLGDREHRGLQGHGAALAQGRLTTGALKLLLLGGGAAAAALSAPPSHPAPGAWFVVGTLLIALTVNGVNLLDVRPGRALKGTLLLLAVAFAADPFRSLPALPGAVAALAVLGWDLREEGVLGDAGANALGAMAGWALWRALPMPASLALLVGLSALHLYAERASLSDGIEGSPILRWFDRLGRLHAGPTGEGGEASN